MNDDRVWRFEESLWRASEDHYHEQVDAECVMALSHAPYLYSGDDAVKAVSGTPEWESVSFSEKTISRPECWMSLRTDPAAVESVTEI